MVEVSEVATTVLDLYPLAVTLMESVAAATRARTAPCEVELLEPSRPDPTPFMGA
jgi:hypothetical protein